MAANREERIADEVLDQLLEGRIRGDGFRNRWFGRRAEEALGGADAQRRDGPSSGRGGGGRSRQSQPTGTRTSSTWRWRTSITPAPRLKASRPTASWSASTRRCSMSSTGSPSGARSIVVWKSYDLDDWLREYNEFRPIRAAGVRARPR